MADINYLELSYPNFVLGQIIDPDEANQNNRDIMNKVNEFVDEVKSANTTSVSADAKADTAIATANNANTKSDTANTKADTAITSAEGAVSTANLAKSTAEGVQTDFNTIKPALDQAIIDANTALDNVETVINGTIFDQIGASTETSTFIATVDNTTSFEIPFAKYSPAYDYLEVIYQGVILDKESNYTTSERIINLTFSINTGEEINYRVTKNQMLNPNFTDGGLIANGTVHKIALETSVQDTLDNVGVLEQQINDLDAFNTNARFKIGSITRDMTLSGNQAITGLGFKPKAIIFIAAKQADVGIFSMGFQSDTEVTDAQVVYDRHNITAENWGTGVNNAIQVYQVSSANYITAKVVTFDVDGFTLLWTPTGTLSGSLTVKYIAFK